jgi:hypothetical protein
VFSSLSFIIRAKKAEKRRKPFSSIFRFYCWNDDEKLQAKEKEKQGSFSGGSLSEERPCPLSKIKRCKIFMSEVSYLM